MEVSVDEIDIKIGVLFNVFAAKFDVFVSDMAN